MVTCWISRTPFPSTKDETILEPAKALVVSNEVVLDVFESEEEHQ